MITFGYLSSAHSHNKETLGVRLPSGKYWHLMFPDEWSVLKENDPGWMADRGWGTVTFRASRLLGVLYGSPKAP